MDHNNHTILIIDDDKTVRENTSELLQLSGYQTYVASNGMAGLRLLKEHKPDLILCDIMMPELDGFGVLHALENMPEMAGTPFVFLTARTDRSEFRRGMNLGADDYLIKPYVGDDLLQVVATRLRKVQRIQKRYDTNLKGLSDFFDQAKQHPEFDMLSEPHKTKRYKRKVMIYMEGDAPGSVYYVVSGKVKIFKSNEMGKEFIVDIHTAGDFFGYAALLENASHTEFAVAIEDTELALISAEDFNRLLFSNREVSARFIQLISKSLHEAEEKLVKLAYDSARKRVAGAILYLAGKYLDTDHKDKAFSMNRENISALAGVSPESVSRNLSDFKEEGLLESDEGSIHILNYRKLEQMKS